MSAKHGKPQGELVEFYLPANEQYKKGYVLPYNINGHDGVAIVGAKNKAPREVVEMLKNCQSRTAVPKLKAVDPGQNGVPRDQAEFFNPKIEHIYQSDFDIAEL